MTYRADHDEWVLNGSKIDDPAKQELIKTEFDRDGEDALIIVKRGYLNGSTSPVVTRIR